MFHYLLLSAFGLHFCSLTSADSSSQPRTLGYENKSFILDGKPFRYISGSIHYFRIHPAQWEDRLMKVRAAGLNAIQLYIPWNYHEVEPGRYDFEGARNVTHFLELAAKHDLYALTRVGPYICAEWENGGLPWWLLRDRDIRMRTSDSRFTTAVKRWFDTLLPMLVPFLIGNGGPILMVQIENEYGAFSACDHVYTEYLRDLTKRNLGSGVLLYTTDWADEKVQTCGSVPEVFPTVDFGPTADDQIESRFSIQRQFSPQGPLVNSEFYTGWFVEWGQKTQDLPGISEVVSSISHMYSLGASFNFYMFHGGTNFGFWNGAEPSAPLITSYDYTAPMTEAGDITPEYLAIRDYIKSLKGWPSPPTEIPPNGPKTKFENVKLDYVGRLDNYLLKNVAGEQDCVASKYPLSFEELNHPYGFVLYTTRLKFAGSNLTIPLLKDHGFTSIDGEPQGTFVDIFGNYSKRWLTLSGAKKGSRLSIIVENRGRQTYQTINDFKGILSNVTLDGGVVDDWFQCGIDFEVLAYKLQKSFRLGKFKNSVFKRKRRGQRLGPGVFFGAFGSKEVADTFFDPTGWGKGVLLVNGKNLGRYWPSVGPQVTLYVPSPVLSYQNYVLLVELEHPGAQCSGSRCVVQFVDHPIFRFTQNSTASHFSI